MSGASGISTIRGVPRKLCRPRGPHVLVRQYDTSRMGSIILPEIARVIVFVASAVGPEVEDIAQGDLLILRDTGSITPVHEISDPATDERYFLIPEGAVAGVIRGYDWRAHLIQGKANDGGTVLVS